MMTRREAISMVGSAGITATVGAQQTAHGQTVEDLPPLSRQRAWLGLLCRGLDTERDYCPRVEGALPARLSGTLYRNGPGLFERNGYRKSTLLDGDGLLRSLEIRDGSARFRCRFVQTDKFKEEAAARRFLHPTWTTLAPGLLENLPGIPSRSQASVLPLVRNGRLLAFDEVGLPTELDPNSLETIGQINPFDLSPACGSVDFKAHTKFDGVSGNWILAGGRSGSHPDLQVLVQDSRGRRLAHASTPNPRHRYTYYHDFFWAGRYAVFHLHPAFLSPLPMLLGQRSFADCLTWHPREGSTWVVVDPQGERPPTIVELPAAWMWHSVNAFVSGDNIIADFVGYDEPDHFLGPDAVLRRVMDSREGSTIHPGTLRRVTIDLNKKRGTTETLVQGHFEFPTIPLAHVGQRHRFVYLASGNLRDGWFHTGVARLDLQTGRHQEYRFGSDCCVSEPVHVPDPSTDVSGTNADTGWLLCDVLDGGSQKNYIAVFDAREVAAGPIATLHLDHHLPISFHGWWQAA